MRQLTLVLSLWVCAPVFAAPPNEPTHRPRIQLIATLDPQKHALEGEAWLQFVNTSDRDVSELFLHLYPNAFASDSTETTSTSVSKPTHGPETRAKS